jgi:hypothetical protein
MSRIIALPVRGVPLNIDSQTRTCALDGELKKVLAIVCPIGNPPAFCLQESFNILSPLGSQSLGLAQGDNGSH